MRITAEVVALSTALVLLLPLLGCESQLRRQMDHYSKTQNQTEARSYLDRVIQQDPRNHEAYFFKARLLLEAGEYEHAREAFARSIELSPRYEEEAAFLLQQQHRNLVQQGTNALGSNDLEDATAAFAGAIDLEPEDPTAFRGLAQALMGLSRWTEAEDAYQRALLLVPGDAEALSNLAELALRREAYGQTADYVRKIFADENVVTDSVRSAALQRLVYAQLGMQQFNEANSTMGTLLRRYSAFDIARTRRDLAFSLFENGYYEEVVPHLQEIARKDTTTMPAKALGEAFYQLGDYRKMREVFRQIVSEHPNDRDARTNLVLANEVLGYRSLADTHRVHLKNLNDSDHAPQASRNE